MEPRHYDVVFLYKKKDFRKEIFNLLCKTSINVLRNVVLESERNDVQKIR